jgi:LAO/AO transport system kinase
MKKKPEWSPSDSGPEFASFLVDGVTPSIRKPYRAKTKGNKDLQYYLDGLNAGDRSVLAQVITIIESNSARHFKLAQDILSSNLNTSHKSIRIGITGAPGAGKSTFIDTFGSLLCELGKKVAVLAIDPSSSVTKGSILGDKTRMENLSRNPNSFIRPSPSGDALGGVARKTRESIFSCESAGYDIIIVETIGVGQSEIMVRSMVDFFLLVLLPGEGDELQGIKKGTVELADLLVINKADGDNKNLAQITRQHYSQALHYTRQATEGWNTPVVTVSALENYGISDLYDIVLDFITHTSSNGAFEQRRKSQMIDWMRNMISNNLNALFYSDKLIRNKFDSYKSAILDGKITVSNAVNELMELFNNRKNDEDTSRHK